MHPPLTLKTYPDPILRETCMPIETFDSWLSDVVHEMFTLMQIHKGIGLAAPQAGLTGRFFVVEIDDHPLCLINPMIIRGGSLNKMTEGCLSLPGLSIEVERDNCIEVAGYTVAGRRQLHRFDGLWAHAIQHEMDHLNGVLICDHERENAAKFKEPV